jgi:hypothetical protein
MTRGVSWVSILGGGAVNSFCPRKGRGQKCHAHTKYRFYILLINKGSTFPTKKFSGQQHFKSSSPPPIDFDQWEFCVAWTTRNSFLGVLSAVPPFLSHARKSKPAERRVRSQSICTSRKNRLKWSRVRVGLT